jgi:hypothetical protein
MSRFDRKMRRRVERKERKAADPWFGKRRPTEMEGNRKAEASKQACRKNKGDHQ